MKNIVLSLLAISLLTGCVRRYDMTLSSGRQFTNVTKPKLVNGVYYFKDGAGQERSAKAIAVKMIEPHNSKKTSGQDFRSGR